MAISRMPVGSLPQEIGAVIAGRRDPSENADDFRGVRRYPVVSLDRRRRWGLRKARTDPHDQFQERSQDIEDDQLEPLKNPGQLLKCSGVGRTLAGHLIQGFYEA